MLGVPGRNSAAVRPFLRPMGRPALTRSTGSASALLFWRLSEGCAGGGPTVLSWPGSSQAPTWGRGSGLRCSPAGSRVEVHPRRATVGAGLGAAFLGAISSGLGLRASRTIDRVGVLRALDGTGGLVAGAVWGLAIVWVAGAIALELPGQVSLRHAVQRSEVLRNLNELAPPRELLNVLARIDPLPVLVGPPPPALPPDRRLLAEPAVRRAAAACSGSPRTRAGSASKAPAGWPGRTAS